LDAALQRRRRGSTLQCRNFKGKRASSRARKQIGANTKKKNEEQTSLYARTNDQNTNTRAQPR
jgi:hypothetical protein